MKRLNVLLILFVSSVYWAVEGVSASVLIKEHLASVHRVSLLVSSSSFDPIPDLDYGALKAAIHQLVRDSLADTPIVITENATNSLIVTFSQEASRSGTNYAILLEVVLYQPALVQLETGEVEGEPIGVATWQTSSVSVVKPHRAEKAILELARIHVEEFVGAVRSAIGAKITAETGIDSDGSGDGSAADVADDSDPDQRGEVYGDGSRDWKYFVQRLSAGMPLDEQLFSSVDKVNFQMSIGSLGPIQDIDNEKKIEALVDIIIAGNLRLSPLEVASDAEDLLLVEIEHKASSKDSTVAVLVELSFYQDVDFDPDTGTGEIKRINVLTYRANRLSLAQQGDAVTMTMRLATSLIKEFVGEARRAIDARKRAESVLESIREVRPSASGHGRQDADGVLRCLREHHGVDDERQRSVDADGSDDQSAAVAAGFV